MSTNNRTTRLFYSTLMMFSMIGALAFKSWKAKNKLFSFSLPVVCTGVSQPVNGRRCVSF